LYQHHSIAQFHKDIEQGILSCETVVRHYLGQISERTHLNAFVEVFTEEALERAKSLDSKKLSGQPLGKLFGVVIGIKDVICYKGHHVTAASRILEGFTSQKMPLSSEALTAMNSPWAPPMSTQPMAGY
jgi:aspartyl-tRNA(Asn)/glutamyl-tRNA(Gln) amidotransferase subunit A